MISARGTAYGTLCLSCNQPLRAKLTCSVPPLRHLDECGSIESVKAASEIYAPLSGEVYAINEKLDDQPSLLNKSPLENGPSLLVAGFASGAQTANVLRFAYA
jgi:hypothetical protein